MSDTTAYPLHHQIYLSLRDELFSGRYAADGDAPDRALPGENELARRYNVSRVTIRRALETLQAEGLVVRRHGAGTFPTHITNRARFGDVESLYADMVGIMSGYTQDILSLGSIATPPHLRRKESGFGPKCYRIKTINEHGGMPVHMRSQFIPSRISGLLEPERLGGEPVLLMLLRKGVKVETTNMRISATGATEEHALLLDVPVGSPLTLKKRYSFDADGLPVEYFEGVSRPDRFEYSFQFKGRQPRGLG